MKKVLLLLLVPLLISATAHKFYVSVTNVNYSEKDDAFQITTRIFIDDLEEVLKERYGIVAKLATDEEADIANSYIEKYFRSKFLMHLDNQLASYEFLGKKYEDDVVICYLEIPNVGMDTLQKFEIENEILTDLFEEQKNVVHVKWQGNKKSFVLIKSNAKGMLKL